MVLGVARRKALQPAVREVPSLDSTSCAQRTSTLWVPKATAFFMPASGPARVTVASIASTCAGMGVSTVPPALSSEVTGVTSGRVTVAFLANRAPST